METIYEEIDQYSVKKESSEKIETLSKLSDFWVKEDLKQNLGSTEDSEFKIKFNQSITSHMQWHLREDVII
jgi:hypothetical protein